MPNCRPDIIAAICLCAKRRGCLDPVALAAVREAWTVDRVALDASEATLAELVATLRVVAEGWTMSATAQVPEEARQYILAIERERFELRARVAELDVDAKTLRRAVEHTVLAK